MGDSSDSSVTSSCCSSTAASIAQPRTPLKQPGIKKIDAFNDVLRRLRDLRLPETEDSAFEDELWAHFDSLPLGYAVEIYLDKLENVLMHKRVLEAARNAAATSPAIEVQLVQFTPPSYNKPGHSLHPNSTGKERLMPEIIISTKDQKMLCSRLGNMLSAVDLNIHEAHIFSTTDCYCLGLFKVDSLRNEDAMELKNELIEEMLKVEKYPWLKKYVKNHSVMNKPKQPVANLECSSTKQSLPVPDREIDPNLLASGSDSDL